MIPALVFTIIVLLGACAALWLMLLAASRDIEALEDFIVEIDESMQGWNMRGEVRAQLAEEADDIRESRKEEGDE